MFHTSDLVVGAFQASALILLTLLIVNRLGVQRVIPYALLGIALWVDDSRLASCPGPRSAPLLQRLEQPLQPWVAFVIMPLFALANAGIRLSGDLVAFLIDPISMGIILGLVVGKQVGVAASCWLLVRVALGSLPSRATWRQLYGVALLCGIGFTMSLFIATLALGDTDHLVAAKIGILTGSISSGTVGYLVLSIQESGRPQGQEPTAESYHRLRDRRRSRMRAAVTAVELLARIWRRVAVGDRTPIDVLLDPGFIAIDFETTGLNARRDAIVAVAAIPFNGGRSRPGLVTLVNPGRPIPPQSTAIHGINDAAVATAPPIREVLPRFDAVCTRRIVVGHDVAFDVAILAQARTTYAGLSPRLTLDTRQLARAVGFRDTALERLAPQLNVAVVGRHTAEGDARMAGEILLALLPRLRRHGARTLGDLLRLQRTAPIED